LSYPDGKTWVTVFEGWNGTGNWFESTSHGDLVIQDTITDAPGSVWQREILQSWGYGAYRQGPSKEDRFGPGNYGGGKPPDAPVNAPPAPPPPSTPASSSRDYTGPIVIGIAALGATALLALAIRHRKQQVSAGALAENPTHFHPTRAPGMQRGDTQPARTGWKPTGWTSIDYKLTRGRQKDFWIEQTIEFQDGNVVMTNEEDIENFPREEALQIVIWDARRAADWRKQEVDEVRVLDERGVVVFEIVKGLVSKPPPEYMRRFLPQDHLFWPSVPRSSTRRSAPPIDPWDRYPARYPARQ
jgi:hypothetical protein